MLTYSLEAPHSVCAWTRVQRISGSIAGCTKPINSPWWRDTRADVYSIQTGSDVRLVSSISGFASACLTELIIKRLPSSWSLHHNVGNAAPLCSVGDRFTAFEWLLHARTRHSLSC